MAEQLRVVFAGGGTAGHLFPGLATAAELAAMSSATRITFAGSGKPLEMRLIAEAGFEYLPLPCAPAPSGPRSLLRFFTQNAAGYRRAKKFLRREIVSVVVGLGGYASLPMARAAIQTNTPLVLLEQNAVPGKATKWLAPRANVVCVAHQSARAGLNCVGPVRVTGNPIRSGFRPRRGKPRDNLAATRNRLLVLGGSGGAHALNEFVPRALYKIREELLGWEIVHQTGTRDAATTAKLYEKLALTARVVPFVQNLPAVLRASDLVLSRAGGTTLAEVAATGVPAILVPYPHAVADHQRHNALPLVASGAARLVDEREIDGRLDDALAVELAELLCNGELRASMSRAMLRHARPDAAWQTAMLIAEVAQQTVLGHAA